MKTIVSPEGTPNNTPQTSQAPIDSSTPEDIYNTAFWGDGYFSVTPNGNLQVSVPSDETPSITLSAQIAQIIKTCQSAELSLPLLVRVTNILQHRAKRLCHAFQNAFNTLELGTSGQYTAIYPIKVNQQKRVVETLVSAGDTDGVNIGLEAGSKPELIAALSSLPDRETLLICNGYKDYEYLALAVDAMRLGYKVMIVVEKLSEFETLLPICKQIGIKPNLGVRVRLNSTGKGNWQNTGGEKGKFGLSAIQLLSFIESLKKEDWLDQLDLLHVHIGSQISDIQDISRCLTEVGHYYHELKKTGAPCSYVDVGGGLGVDYEGTASSNYHSINYSMEEYALTVTEVLHRVCEQAELPLPHLLTESGRALTAHHAILLTDVVDSEHIGETLSSQLNNNINNSLNNTEVHPNVEQLAKLCDACKGPLKHRESLTLYHQLRGQLEQCHQLFQAGTLSLNAKAMAEYYFQQGCVRLQPLLDQTSRAHRPAIDDLNDLLAHRLFLNFSLFQSTPDVWGIGQIFPIMPVAGLNEKNYVRATLSDLTCDSDGRFDAYVDGMGLEQTLPLPQSSTKKGAALGIFLVGAYQEILGDLHNLFGDTNSVDVTLTGPDTFKLGSLKQGDTAEAVLQTVNYESTHIRAALEEKIMNSELPQHEKIEMLKHFQRVIARSTYLR